MITVDSLVHDFGFEISYLAGSSHGSRPLSWAHVIDLNDPWNWIDRGELILTTGGGIPEAAEQEDWIRKVIESGANGLVIAPRPGTASLSIAALNLANEQGFPVLTASFGSKFTELAKEIINNSLQRDSRRLAAAQRAFSVYSTSLLRDEPLAARLRGIARNIDINFVITDGHGLTLAQSSTPPSDNAHAAVLDSWIEPLTASIQMETREGDDVDPSLRQSFITIVAIELQRQIAHIGMSNRTASLLAKDVLVGQLELPELLHFLGATELQLNDSYGFVSVKDGDNFDGIWERFLALSLWGIIWAGVVHRGSFGILVPTTDEALTAVQLALAGLPMGISDPISANNPPADAFNQAILAAEYASDDRLFVSAHDVFTEELLFPSSNEQCRMIANTLLGPIARYDNEQGTDLLATLETYYRNNLSPGKASDALYIHRHTLIYRLKTIERLTNMNPSATRSVATLWIALEAARRSNWNR